MDKIWRYKRTVAKTPQSVLRKVQRHLGEKYLAVSVQYQVEARERGMRRFSVGYVPR